MFDPTVTNEVVLFPELFQSCFVDGLKEASPNLIGFELTSFGETTLVESLTVVPTPAVKLIPNVPSVATTAKSPVVIVAVLLAVNHATVPVMEAAVERTNTPNAGIITFDFFIIIIFSLLNDKNHSTSSIFLN